ncbi:GGDEF domain-containing protein [Anaeromyxobacter sp. PSR-1]|uniref:GGDEF domain-containing protein n=1 Tax=unclassified Anaeromyxobacter TaxID=2620896 RepID=UPI0005DFC61E|nr:GGDEF domain-containing protein [Anaeromyxobacter sp. PSR-1]GAO05013.1 putative diguanylate cyclase AdrA [Anaeromyxobacter sp. PSR-1]
MPVEERSERTWTTLPNTPCAAGRRHAFLLVLAGPQLGDIYPLAPDRELVIGRRDDCDLPIRDDGVSRRHAAIRVEGEGALLRDLGSANGTYVDGVRAEGEVRLADGGRVSLGGATVLKFAWADELEARWQMKLAEIALLDPLTGVFNRRHLDDRLAAELAAAQRHGRSMSVLLVDVDRFRAVNEAHGQAAGDEALKMVAFVLRGALRREDVLARAGGAAFAVIARETTLAGGRALGERIRRAVARSRCAWQPEGGGEPASIGVKVSVGVAEVAEGRTQREVMESAGRALQLAKQAGRNTVVALPMAPAEGRPDPAQAAMTRGGAAP